MNTPPHPVSPLPDHSRRDFLVTATAVTASAGVAASLAQAADEQKMPQIQIGKHSISRLICGCNPFGAMSHTSPMMDFEFRQYYTLEQIAQTVRKCQEEGINTVQGLTPERYQALLKAGGKMQVLANGRGDPAGIKNLIANGAIGIHHYGVTTDALYRQGKLPVAREYLRRVRDAGVLTGLTTHLPAVVEIAESEGWDVDYYMTCVYQWGRTTQDIEKLFGDRKDLMPVEAYSMVVGDGYAEVFLNGDPPKMYKVIRQVKKPCLAYKILAAGRKCLTPETIEQAFQDAFQNIKRTDAIIVGMYDRYIDQVAENCGYVRRFGAAGV
ncbi:MAG: twin-arginine translocation signal domain-containing protein [Candidatus Solibacter sp.]